MSYFCWLIRVSLFIELGGAGDLGTRKPKPWTNLRLKFKPTSDKTSGQTSGKLVLTLCKNKWLRTIYEDEPACVILTLLNIIYYVEVGYSRIRVIFLLDNRHCDSNWTKEYTSQKYTLNSKCNTTGRLVPSWVDGYLMPLCTPLGPLCALTCPLCSHYAPLPLTCPLCAPLHMPYAPIMHPLYALMHPLCGPNVLLCAPYMPLHAPYVPLCTPTYPLCVPYTPLRHSLCAPYVSLMCPLCPLHIIYMPLMCPLCAPYVSFMCPLCPPYVPLACL